eukprot:PhM_4_TR637/c0_g1_i1/m.1986/K18045/SIW14, OCA3; tyrosine-protein phosphatase SIW14
MIPPQPFGQVEPDVYRCGIPSEPHTAYLRSLRLKTIVLLTHEKVVASVRRDVLDLTPNVVALGEQHWTSCPPSSSSSASCVPVGDDFVKDALELVLDVTKHPLLLVCGTYGRTSNLVVACLRRLQRWSMNSIFSEMETYVPGASSSEMHLMQWVEAWDPSLVTPRTDALPLWFRQGRAVDRKLAAERAMLAKPSPLPPLPTTPTGGSPTKALQPQPAYVVYGCRANVPALSEKSTYDPKESLVAEDDD